MSNNLQLAELLLENNRCTSIPAVVQELQGMTELRFTSNRILSILDNLGNAAKLCVLHLEHNMIKVMPPTMSLLTTLQVLRLCNNSLLEVPSSFVKVRPLDDPPRHVSSDEQGQKQVFA